MNALRKYPRTPHLPWSPGGTSDDRVLKDTAHFIGHQVIVTEKMDGENTSLYRDTLHARSLDSRHHSSRNWVKALHGRIQNDIPEGWRLCGENLYARHSIAYDDLDSYFQLFSIWNEENIALSWDETTDWTTLLGLELVPILFRGLWDQKSISEITLDPTKQEGYVVRVADRIRFDDFDTSVAKWVRPGHVRTDQHWMYAEIVPNGLREGAPP